MASFKMLYSTLRDETAYDTENNMNLDAIENNTDDKVDSSNEEPARPPAQMIFQKETDEKTDEEAVEGIEEGSDENAALGKEAKENSVDEEDVRDENEKGIAT